MISRLHKTRFPLALLVFPALLSLDLHAEEKAKKLSDNSLRVPGIFNSVLPGTEEKNSLKFKVHPHFGDLSKRDHIRTDLGLSYGLTERWDVIGKTRFYFGHGLKDVGLFQDPGLADYVLESKYRLGAFILPGWDSAINFSYAAPLGNPAPKVTDGLIHRATTLSFARSLKNHPGVRAFWGLTTDIISETDVVGRLEKNELRDSFQSFSGGFIVERGRTHYTFEAAYATTRFWGAGGREVYSVRPGIVWQVPRRFTFNSEGEWLVGAATPISFGPDGTDIGINLKLRLNFDFKRKPDYEDPGMPAEVAAAYLRQ